MSDPVPNRTSRTTRADRRYRLRFAVSMAAYVVLLPVCLVLLPRVPVGAGRYLLMLVPVVPMAAVGWAVWKFLAETDEFQRKVQLEALGIGFAGGSVVTFGYGLLELAGAPSVSWLIVWPVYAICWLAGRLITWLRYR